MSLPDTYRGLRVLDLSAYLAGPFASMILGDMGADVVKIERPPAGDETRALPPRWGEDATVFYSVNRNKRSVLLDFRTPDGREALMRLVRGADVLVESFPPGVAGKLSLRFEDLHRCNERLVVCSVSAFGDGPIGAGMPGFDALVQAVSGLMSFTGEADSAPVRLPPSVLDLTTGLWGVIGIMAALARRERGGTGEHVQPSLIDSAFAMMSHQVLGYLATGELPRKLGTGAPSAMPYRVYEAADGSFMLAPASDAQFVRLCAALGMEALGQDPRFATMAARLSARDTLDGLLSDAFRQQPVSTWLQRLAQAGIASGPVNDIRQALALPVVAERELLVAPEQIAWKGGMAQMRLPIDADGAGPGLGSPPPGLGQHTEEVLREAGFEPETIARLTRRN
jgi:crotonobetainyl-CoA:carnitine CoA-transferase CaiB-like acyl-CoA transferase